MTLRPKEPIKTFVVIVFFSLISVSFFLREYRAVIVTDIGNIEIQLFQSKLPSTIKHFKGLIDSGVYNNASFYRVVEGEYIQGGQGFDKAHLAKPVQQEFALPDNQQWTVGFAWQSLSDKNSATTEFYILLKHQPLMDEMGFIAFGEVVKGRDVVRKIAEAPVFYDYKYWEDGLWSESPVSSGLAVPWFNPKDRIVIRRVYYKTCIYQCLLIVPL